jgi:polyhydroxybutyrate depolymerase
VYHVRLAFLSLTATLVAASCGIWESSKKPSGAYSDDASGDDASLPRSAGKRTGKASQERADEEEQEAVAEVISAYFEGRVQSSSPAPSVADEVELPEVSEEPLGPGDHVLSVVSGERVRTVRVHVPAAYNGTTPWPIVLVLHGGMRNAKAAQASFGFDAKADAAGFLVAYPDGLPLSEKAEDRGRNFWAFADGTEQARADDVAFIAAAMAALELRLSVDPARIYAVGYSAGGMMAHRLGCELSARIAAIASVAGTLEVAFCEPERAMPVLLLHGTADEFVPMDGDGPHGFQSVDFTVDSWLTLNACDSNLRELAPLPDVMMKDGTLTSVATYPRCKEGAEVRLYTVLNGGHTWPGMQNAYPYVLGEDVRDDPLSYHLQLRALGLTAYDYTAPDLLWEFLRRFQR